jgi:hypothetical protein
MFNGDQTRAVGKPLDTSQPQLSRAGRSNMPLVDSRFLDHIVPGRATSMLDSPGSTMLERAAYLDPDDRRIIELSLGDMLTHRQIASQLGVPPGTISRRIRNISRRLRDPIVLSLIERGEVLPELARSLALARFLNRRSSAQLARMHRINVNEINKSLAYVRGWHRGLTHVTRREGGLDVA